MPQMYTAPKTIINHPAVEECLDAVEGGFEPYIHDVWLKEGWSFERGRMAECRGARFKTVADFKHANPIKEQSS